MIEFSFFAADIDASAVEMVFWGSSTHLKVGKIGITGQEA